MGRVPPFASIGIGSLKDGRFILVALDFDGRVWEKVESQPWTRTKTGTTDEPETDEEEV